MNFNYFFLDTKMWRVMVSIHFPTSSTSSCIIHVFYILFLSLPSQFECTSCLKALFIIAKDNAIHGNIAFTAVWLERVIRICHIRKQRSDNPS